MGTVRVRSRINQHFSPALLVDLYKVCKNVTVSDNNLKVEAMIATLDRYKMDYVELGPGTNRLAILIDNYVFKIALDKQGMQDNLNEFTISKELQPYVVKTYETNGLLSACEYVTVISREEFIEKKDEIKDILAILGESYLLGDVGTLPRNFTNWGYRDNGDLVILDFAYIFRVGGEELLCSNENHETTFLEYDENFNSLRCPRCQKKYSFMDIRRRITVEAERHENEIAKQLAYMLTKPIQIFDDGYDEEDNKKSTSLYTNKAVTPTLKEETQMSKHFRDEDEMVVSQEERDEAYLEELQSLMNPQPTLERNESETVVEINRQTPDTQASIKVFRHGVQVDGAGDPIDKAIQHIEKLADDADASSVEGRPSEDEIVDELLEEIAEISANAAEDAYESNAPIVSGGVNEQRYVEGNTVTNVKEAHVVIETEDTTIQADIRRVNQEELVPVPQYVEQVKPVGNIDTVSISPDVEVQVKEEVILAEQKIEISDGVSVTSSIKLEVSDEEKAEALRRQLMAGSDEQAAGSESVEFVDDDENDRLLDQNHRDSNMKGGNKQWD